MNDQPHEIQSGESFGPYLKHLRQSLGLSLRDVEEQTDGQVSNAYLSQLENERIAKPSPHILYALSGAYLVPPEKLMDRAGYAPPRPAVTGRAAKHGRAATYSIDNLTANEEAELLKYLAYWRTTQRREKTR